MLVFRKHNSTKKDENIIIWGGVDVNFIIMKNVLSRFLFVLCTIPTLDDCKVPLQKN